MPGRTPSRRCCPSRARWRSWRGWTPVASGGVVGVLLAASIPYAHPVSALVLIPLGLYAIVRIAEGSTPVRTPALVIAAAGVIVLLIPVVRELSALANRSNDWNVPGALTGWWVVATLLPASFAAAALTGLILTIRNKARFALRRPPVSTQVLLGGWLLSRVRRCSGSRSSPPVQLLGTRYFMMIAPAAAILAATFIGGLESAARSPHRCACDRAGVCGRCGLSLQVGGHPQRDRVGRLRGRRSHGDVPWVRVPGVAPADVVRRRSGKGLLTAPDLLLPAPGRRVALPTDLTQRSAPFARDEIERAIASGDRIVVITVTGSPYEAWLEEVFRGSGYSSRTLAASSCSR